ncbi:MAG TPA: SDR family oxidoreductase [Arthrobacter sp.]|nr:SDR family oxidoreductase [Arthrobacter sp.]
MTEQGDIVLVTGATGNTGGAVLDALVRRDLRVRAMVRSEADRVKLPDGVQAVIADFDDPASIAAAMVGARSAYLVTPSSERAEEQQRRFADLAAKAGLHHLVVLSQLAADEHSPVRFLRYHAAVEQHVRDLGIPYTFLRPNLFFQGLLAFARPVAAEGRFYAPVGDARVSAVDVRDIGAVAAVTLTEPGHEGATYTLTGPSAITHAQIAGALTAALGRQVNFVDVPPSAFADSLRGVLPPWQVDGLLEDYAHYRRGEAAVVSSAVTEITGTAPRDVAQFARDYAPAFSGLPEGR